MIPPVHRFLRILSTALITAGLVILADVGLTLAWKEPLSAIYGSIQQRKAEDQLDELKERFPTAADLEAAARLGSIEEQVEALADELRGRGRDRQGDRAHQDRCDRPRCGRGRGHRHGIAPEGPGPLHRAPTTRTPAGSGDGSAFPGQGETVGIAGHRTTYLAPFRRLDELEQGDELVLEMPYATFTYEVEKTDIVDPSEFERRAATWTTSGSS